jgi:2,4-dienoyl-CoA reductase (NADPH2)
MGKVSVPLVATNRINTPELAEQLLAAGACDMVSMARPFLADADFVRKAREGRADEINTCIGCNQACLDHTFAGKVTSCLVNPRACHETEIVIRPAAPRKRVAIVGAGPAGLACAVTAASRGHAVTLFEAGPEIGGQFNIAKKVPGKEEFSETLRYFRRQIGLTGVELRLGTCASAEGLMQEGFDEVIVATGVLPRELRIEGAHHAKVLGYLDVLRDGKPVGSNVAIVGAGGIGFDVAEYLVHEGESASLDPQKFFAEWGVDTDYAERGGLRRAEVGLAARGVHLLQRRSSKVGENLGKTTGWIHRTALKARGVGMSSSVEYQRIDDDGLHVSIDGVPQTLAVDTVVVCAGQESLSELADQLLAAGRKVHVIGGAAEAAELDAKRAIHEGTTLAASL